MFLNVTSFRYDWMSLYNLSMVVAKQLAQLKLIMHVAFSHPPGPEWEGALSRDRLFFVNKHGHYFYIVNYTVQD
jgi:hypothetical protein